MATLGPVGVVVGLEGIHLLLTFLTLAASCFSCGDTEWRQLLGSNELIGHHIGSANLKPTLHGIVLARNQLNDELWLTSCGLVTSLVLVEVIAYHTMLYLCHVSIVERIGRIIADAGFETL